MHSINTTRVRARMHSMYTLVVGGRVLLSGSSGSFSDLSDLSDLSTLNCIGPFIQELMRQ